MEEPADAHFRRADYCDGQAVGQHWMLGLLTHDECKLVRQLSEHPRISRFAELADVDVGIVTGANKYFLVPDAIVDKYNLRRWAHPMFGRSDHVPGVIYDHSTHRENQVVRRPTNFLWFPHDGSEELSESARRYIRTGERLKLHLRYKCRVRSPWYRVPSVYAAPVGMLKRAHHFPRLILNEAKAFTTDTAYRVMPKSVRPADLVVAFVNSLTALSCELEGRHYGGGVLELVPTEIERVLVPSGRYPRTTLTALDAALRAGRAAEEILQAQDSAILRSLGLSKSNCQTLLLAWDRLRSRRQRKHSGLRNGR
jgi:hypothetical protein